MKNEIQILKDIFKQEVELVNKEIIENTKSYVTNLTEEVAMHLLSGGKRLRPLFVLASARMCGYSGGDSHIKIAAAIEFIHSATLLHDDVIDSSKIRHNNITANNIWGNKSAILVGDFLFSQAFRLMVQAGSLEVLNLLANSSKIISEGEVWQLSLLEKDIVSLDEYMSLIKYKTATLFSASCLSASIISHSDLKIQNALKQFGELFGMLYQIQDDMLDYFGDEDQTGKSIGSDFFEGKFTLPIIIQIQIASNDDRDKLKNILSRREKDDFIELLSMLKKYKIRDHIRKISSSLVARAEDYLIQLDLHNNEVKDIFILMLRSWFSRTI